jgi:hypothetical protein
MSLPEQWEKQVQAIQRLKVGEAFVRLADDTVHKIRTRTLPRIGEQTLGQIRRQYLQRYFRSPNSTEKVAKAPVVVPAITRRPRVRSLS